MWRISKTFFFFFSHCFDHVSANHKNSIYAHVLGKFANKELLTCLRTEGFVSACTCPIVTTSEEQETLTAGKKEL